MSFVVGNEWHTIFMKFFLFLLITFIILRSDLEKSRRLLEFFRSDLVLPKPDCYIIYDVRNGADAFYNFMGFNFILLVSWKIYSIKKAVSRFTRNCLNIFMDN